MSKAKPYEYMVFVMSKAKPYEYMVFVSIGIGFLFS